MSATLPTHNDELALVQPLLVCPGVQKAASTWIHRQLEAHPEVSCTTRKEIDFWGARYAKGHAWYAAQFPAPGERKLYADITPAYFLDRTLPERLARDCPDARVLVLLRDPYERTFSSYQHSLRSGDVRSDFATALQQVPELLDYSRYASGLASYFRHFPRERVKIMFTEALEAEPRAALRELYAFAGVNPDFVPPDMDKRVNVGQAYSRGRHALETVERFCKDRGLERKHLKRLGLDRLLDDLHGWFARRHRRPELPAEARALLAPVLEPEIDALEQLLGMDFSAWRWSEGVRLSPADGARAAQPSSPAQALGVHAS